MRCSSKIKVLFLGMALMLLLCACGQEQIDLQYGQINLPEQYNIDTQNSPVQISLFAEDYCAVASDITATSTIDFTQINSAGIYNLNDREVMYSYMANERINPASLTKVMTALLVLENCNPDDMVTVADVTIYEDGVQLFNLKEGDKISVRDLLYITMVYSGNDAALALAKHVAGTEEAFAEMMNARALALGATNTNFVNPHGLSNENHYTTAYDLYLIFQEAIKHDLFMEIINTQSYTVTYSDAAGEFIEKTINTTNKFLNGDYDFPNTLSIIGGKTGSTMAAGKCIILYATSPSGEPYVCVIMGAADEASLYNTMTTLCNEVVH